MESNKEFQQAIDQLEQTKDTVGAILKNHPTHTLRVTSVLDKLINGLKFITGGNVGETTNQHEPLKPLRRMFGRPIAGPVKAEPKAVEPGEVKVLRDSAKAAYETFLDRESAELKEALSDMEIRSVAKLAGMNWVTGAKPANVDVKFIDSIKEAITKKKQLEKARAEQAIKDERAEVLTNLDFTLDSEAKTWTFGELTITEEQLLDDAIFDKLDELVEGELIKAKAANDKKIEDAKKEAQRLEAEANESVGSASTEASGANTEGAGKKPVVVDGKDISTASLIAHGSDAAKASAKALPTTPGTKATEQKPHAHKQDPDKK